MENKCDVIDFSKPKGYKTKDWLALEDLQKRCKGKIKKWRSAQGGDFTEVKKGVLHQGGSLVIKNDRGIWGCDYQTKDEKHCMTGTFVDGMRKVFGKIKVIKRSNNKPLTVTEKNAFR